MRDTKNTITAPQVETGVDEFTLVLQPSVLGSALEWPVKAEAIIDEFKQKSKIEDVFEEMEPCCDKLMKGYNCGYRLTSRPYYLCICYHGSHQNMGICVKFSATCYAVYKREFLARYGETMNVAKFLRMVESDNYRQNLSRIDFTADYFNFDDSFLGNQYIHPHLIYTKILDKSLAIVDCHGKENIKVHSALNKNGTFETVYIGSRKANTNSFMRIYDKKTEQIENQGCYAKLAYDVKSWIRFEAVYKGIYSKQICKALMEDVSIQTDQDVRCFAAGKILEKYMFQIRRKSVMTDFTEALIQILSGQKYQLMISPSARDNALSRSLLYLYRNSGLMSTLAKVEYIYPCIDAPRMLLNWLEDMYYSYYIPGVDNDATNEVHKWVRKHKAELINEPFDQYLEDVGITIEKEFAHTGGTRHE